jgi:hypothetical protein
MAIGRNDLAASAEETVEQFNRDGFKSKKDFFVSGLSLAVCALFRNVQNILTLRILANLARQSATSYPLLGPLGEERSTLSLV